MVHYHDHKQTELLFQLQHVRLVENVKTLVPEYLLRTRERKFFYCTKISHNLHYKLVPEDLRIL